MGILSNLFKPKSAKSKSERPEGRPSFGSFSGRARQDEETSPVEAGDTQPSPEAATEDGPQLGVTFGRFKRNATAKPEPSGQESLKSIAISATPASAAEIKSHTRSIVPVKAAVLSDKEVAIDIADVLPQIPPQLLKTARGTGAKKSLLFNTYELLPGLSQGKTMVPVSRIAELAPEFFNGQAPATDAQVELPLQKIAAQIGVFPGRQDQVEEIYPPLDGRYAKLVLEKSSATPEAPPAAIETPVAVVETPAPVSKASPAIEPAPIVEAPVLEEKADSPAASSNGHAESRAETPPEIETVSYSLASIFPHVPKAWLDGNLKSVDGAARITVPFELVEVQLATGRVELPFEDFLRALPENLKGHFSGDREEGRAAKVLIPLHEVFQNLPGVEPLAPPEPKPAPPEPEDEVETAHVTEIEETQAEIAPEPVARAEPIAAESIPVIEEEKPVAAEAASPVPENLQPAPETAPEPPAPAAVEAAPVEVPATPIAAPVEAEKPAEAIQQPVAEPVIEPAPAKLEPAAEIEPVAAVVEPQPVATPAPAPEPPKVAVAPPPVTAYVEPPQAAGFITPRIHIQRMAAPALLPATASMPYPETPAHEPEEPKVPAPGEPVVAGEPAAEPVEPVAAPASGASIINFIATDGKLDTRKTVEHVILLPGIKAAALTIKGKTKTAGGMPENFHAHDTGKALFQSLETHAPRGPQGAVRSVTLHHDQFSTTFFKQNGIQLCVLHTQRSLDTEPHDALLIVMQEIVRLRQH